MAKLIQCSLVLVIVLLAGEARAQAFDPNCYYPRVGNPNEIDTIYGSRDNQNLGWRVVSLPAPGEGTPSRLHIGGLDKDLNVLAEVKVKVPFDLHKLETFRKWRPGGLDGITKVAHLRNTHDWDVVVASTSYTLVYFPDSIGNYDSARRVWLNWSQPKDSSLIGQISEPYISHFSSDSTEDIVVLSLHIKDKPTRLWDSQYVNFFNGRKLRTNGLTYPDSSLFLKNLYEETTVSQGFFRGSGTEDAVFVSSSNTSSSNTSWFVRGRGPSEFSLAAIRDDLLKPTLWDKPAAITNNLKIYVSRVFPKAPWDHSQDLILLWETSDDRNRSFWMYKGKPDFGDKRLDLDSPDFLLWNPIHYDPNAFYQSTPQGFAECGDMTGTGNPVFCIGAGQGLSGTALMMFYVGGRALDDKIDMYYKIGPHFDGIGMPQLESGTKYKDVLTGAPSYYSYDDLPKRSLGTLHLIKGSPKIPVRLNPQLSVQRSSQVASLKAFPNPCREFTVLEFEATGPRARIILRNVLGRAVYEQVKTVSNGRFQLRVDLDDLPGGALPVGRYQIEVENGNRIFTCPLTIVR